MKNKIFLTIPSLLFATFSYSQQTLSINQITGSQSVYEGITFGNKTLKYEDIKGSPYFDKTFEMAKIASNYENLPIRYNSYKDEIEFQKNGDIRVLPKQKEFSNIEIISPPKKIVLLDTNDELSGYFIELIPGKIRLYKKLKTIFKDAIPATNSYASSKPAEFLNLDPVYYILTEKTIIKKPKNSKEIIEIFNDKKDSINSFIKNNKIKFNKEEDLIRLVNFLNEI